MTPELVLQSDINNRSDASVRIVGAAWGTQSARRHGHFGPKSAPVTAISDRERKGSFN